jgi:hypothetical protein
MTSIAVNQIRDKYFSSQLNMGELLYGFCSAYEKVNLLKSLFKSRKSCYLIGFSNLGVHNYCIDKTDIPKNYRFYSWKDIDDITFRFAGPQALLSFISHKEKESNFLLQIEENAKHIKLDKKAIVFLMMKVGEIA